MITIATPRGVTIGSDLRSVATIGFGSAACEISTHRWTHGVTVIRSVSRSSATIAFADLRRSGDGIGITAGGIGSGSG
jgi:hypothetical protein